jgi:hypothetical protein
VVKIRALDSARGSAVLVGSSAALTGSGAKVVSGGGSYPDATNTGVTPGTTLSTGWFPYDFYGSADGAIWNGYQISCTGPMEHPSGDAGKTITYRNCRFIDSGVYWMVLNENGAKLVFEDCTFVGTRTNPANDAALNGSDITLRRCNIADTGDGIKIGSRVVMEDCFIHDLYTREESHNDSIQSLGTSGNGTEGSGARIVHNTFDAFNGATCITLSTGSATDMRDILVEDNLFYCNGVSVNGGYQSGVDDVSKVSNIIYRNNKAKAGCYTPVFTSTDSPVVVSGTTWYDGPNAGLPV